MKTRITWGCGKTLPAKNARRGSKLACPFCGGHPTARTPIFASTSHPHKLRSCHGLLVAALAGLVTVCGLIVLVGWLLLKAPTRVALQRQPVVQLKRKPDASTSKPVLSPTVRTEDHVAILDDPPVRDTPRETVKLQRGGQTPAVPRLAPALALALAFDRAESNEPASDSQVDPLTEPEDPPPAKRSPLQWSMESSASSPRSTSGQMLILPIEIARIDNDPLPHSILRLKFPDPAMKQLRLAVTPSPYDDMAMLLRALGEGYRPTTIRNEDLYSFNTLKEFDVLFLTCATFKPQDVQAIAPLRKFVEVGGTLYASDLRCELLLRVFPEFRAKAPIFPGIPQNINANVVDAGLQSYLGRKIVPLSLESPDWWPAAFDPAKVSVCIRGYYRNTLGQSWTVPLMVKFPVQRGTVIFTAFHNSKNDSALVRKLLEYQIFSSVSARSEARIKELMQRCRFAPQDLRTILLQESKIADGTYQHKAGSLQIALGFENVGARLKLTLQAPSGKMLEHEDRGLYLIEIPRAERGEWRYTITPVELPYPNFPVIAAVGMGNS